MKFYIKPSFSLNKKYYSLYTSILLLLLSIYLLYKNKGTLILQYLLFIVGFISIIHHCRSFDDEYNDIFRIIDICFANILGLYIIYLYPNEITFGFIFLISFLFLYTQNKCKSSKVQSLLHSIIHISVIIIILLNNP